MLTIRLFGGASLESPDGPLTGRAAQRRPLALLALLAADRARSIGRDRLMLLLAPESDTERARHLLRDTVYALRAVMGPDAIVAVGDELRLDRSAVHCDLWEFEAALEAGDLALAVARRVGPFLEGFHLRDSPEFDSWVASERDRLDARCAEALEALARAAMVRDDFGTAAKWWSERLAMDPLNARATLGLMTALEASGDVAGALRRAATHAALVQAELGGPPDASVVALADRMRREPRLARPSESAPSRPALAGIVDAGSEEVRRAESRTAGSPARSRRRTLWTVAVAGAALVGVWFIVGSSDAPTPATFDPRRVAVAPFRNATGDPALDPIGSMAAAWITQGLTQTALVEVVPPIAVLGAVRRPAAQDERFADDTAPVMSVARGTGAGTVVFGAYYREGDELHFQVQIADARRGVVLVALEPARAPVAAPLRAIEQLRQRTLTSLAPLLDARMSAGASVSSQPPSYAAYRDYADGLEHFVAGDLPVALDLFERAAAADTGYTSPRLWAALTRWNSGDHRGADSLARLVAASGARLPRMDESILRSILAWGRGDWVAAYDAATRARSDAPGSGMAAAQVAVEARRLNRPGEARTILRALDPDVGELQGWVYYWQDLAEAHHLLGNHRAELAAARQARERHPDHAVSRLIELRALAALGRTTELHARLDDALSGAAASLFGGLVRESALEMIAHGRAAEAAPLLTRGIDWYQAQLTREASVRLERGLGRLLAMRGERAEAARIMEGLAPPPPSPGSVDHVGFQAMLAQSGGDRARADELLQELERLDIPMANGRVHWWRAAVMGHRGECGAALGVLREGLSRGVEFGMELHGAFELVPLRRCSGWDALVKPRG